MSRKPQLEDPYLGEVESDVLRRSNGWVRTSGTAFHPGPYWEPV